MRTALRINAPCHEDWSMMTPRGPGRHCAACDTVVIDLVALSTPERLSALARINTTVEGGERVCVRGHVGQSGHLLPAAPAKRRVLTNRMAGILAAVAALALGGQAQAVEAGTARTDPEATPLPMRGEAVAIPPAIAGGICAPESAVDPEPVRDPTPASRPRVLMGDVCEPAPGAPLLGKRAAPGPVTPVDGR